MGGKQQRQSSSPGLQSRVQRLDREELMTSRPSWPRVQTPIAHKDHPHLAGGLMFSSNTRLKHPRDTTHTPFPFHILE